MPRTTLPRAPLAEADHDRLDYSKSKKPVDLPEGLRVRSLVLQGRPWLDSLPAGLSCYELDLRGTPLRRLPDDLRVR